MKSIDILDFRVAALLRYFRSKFNTINLEFVFDTNREFERVMYRYFSDMVLSYKKADDMLGLLTALESQKMFKVDTEISDFLKEWSDQLTKSTKEADSIQLCYDIVEVSAPQVFSFYKSNVSISLLSLIWGFSIDIDEGSRRFLALMIIYMLTKAFAQDPEEFKDKLKALESFFYIRDYLLNDKDLPVEYMNQNLEDLEVKSLMVPTELRIVENLKTITASSGVAQSVEREDLEGKNKKEHEKSEKKKYNRIEKLEDY